jgi:exonuclease VII large subunit
MQMFWLGVFCGSVVTAIIAFLVVGHYAEKFKAEAEKAEEEKNNLIANFASELKHLEMFAQDVTKTMYSVSETIDSVFKKLDQDVTETMQSLSETLDSVSKKLDQEHPTNAKKSQARSNNFLRDSIENAIRSATNDSVEL